jgi:hypothetical protein
MKRKFFSLIFFCFALVNFTCKKHSVNPVDTLPPATQTGANTFGCLINGKAFTPGGSSFSGPNLTATYEYLISGTPNGYSFNVGAGDLRNTCNVTGIGFGFDSLSINTGTYPLHLRKNGQGGGDIRLGFAMAIQVYMILMIV